MDKINLYRSLKNVIDALDEQRDELEYILYTLDTDITELEEDSDDFNLCFGGSFTVEMAMDKVKEVRKILADMKSKVNESIKWGE